MLATVSGESCFIWNIYFQFYHWKNKVVFYSFFGAIALSYPPRVRVRATFKLSAAFFHDESSLTIGGGYESAIAPFLYMTKTDLFSLSVCILFVLFCIPAWPMFFTIVGKKSTRDSFMPHFEEDFYDADRWLWTNN